MSVLSVAAMMGALAVVVLVGFLIPALLEFRKTVVRLREFLERTEANLDPALRELRETMADLRVLADATASKADEVKTIMTALGDTGKNVHEINDVIGSVFKVFNKPAAYWTGAKAAGKFILDRMRKKGGQAQ